jgi:hypothetical protein
MLAGKHACRLAGKHACMHAYALRRAGRPRRPGEQAFRQAGRQAFRQACKQAVTCCALSPPPRAPLAALLAWAKTSLEGAEKKESLSRRQGLRPAF